MALFSADMGFLLLRMSASRSPEMGSCLTEPWVEEIGGVRLVRAYAEEDQIAIASVEFVSRAPLVISQPICDQKKKGAGMDGGSEMGDTLNLPEHFSLSRSSLDAKGKTTCCGAVYLQIVDFRMRKELFDCWLEFSAVHVLQSDEAATARVGLDCARASAQLLGKTGLLRITRASIGVNIDRTRLRKRFDASESIIGK